MESSIRFASFNASLNRNTAGQLVTDLSTPNNAQAKVIAEIVQRNNPDVVLINEFDYDPAAAELFNDNYLSVSQNGVPPVDYPYFYIAPSNTGIASGFDLNNNGATVTTPGASGYGDDAFGFGNFPGHFGMVLYSKYPIDTENVRTFQEFLWQDMPGNLLTNDPTIDDPTTPVNENLGNFYSAEEQAVLRLSSKSHWDVPILVNGETVHVLASHPTPPVFDGTEDRNGKRNADEIRFWADYVTPGQGGYIYDDNGQTGGLAAGASFVIMGDQNADPYDGDSYNDAVLQLLQNPNINTNLIPTSPGGPEQAGLDGGANTTHQGNPIYDTADFADGAPGNLRADYVLPSADLNVADSGIFWPLESDPLFAPLVGNFPFPSSDHKLVYVDVQVGTTPAAQSVVAPTFAGQEIFATGFIPTGAAGSINGTPVPVGGLSSIAYDAANNRYFAIADDRSSNARFYTLTIGLNDGDIDAGDVTFTNVTQLQDAGGNPFAANSLDPEGIALTQNGTVFISSEGEVSGNQIVNPFINEFNLTTGQQIRSLPIPTKFLPVIVDTNGDGTLDTGETQTAGVRNNLVFESLTISPNQQFLYTATENALVQDGPAASLTAGSPNRIIQYNLATGQPEKEYLYVTEPVALPPNPAGQFSTNGLVDLLAIDDRGTFLALERSFAVGAVGTPGNTGNTIKLYEISLQGATDISFYDALSSLTAAQQAAIQPVQKRLVLEFDDLNLPTGTDNIEGLAFGPKLADGSQSIVIVSDNNFSQTQFTQILALNANVVPAELKGVASGDTTQDSTVLWGWSNFAGTVTFEYSTDSTFSTLAGTTTATVTDPLVPVKVEVTGLDANTQYYYRVTDPLGNSDIGQFLTAAALGTQAGLRFGVSGDWRGELAPYPSIANADERDLAFFVEHGDTIYADDDSPGLIDPATGLPQDQAITLNDYRLKHSEVYGDRFGVNTWEDLRASTSILATIDDHEVTNDFAGGELASLDPRFNDSTPGRLINDTELYDNGLQAFQEYNPIRDDFYGSLPDDARTDGERKLYRNNTYGSDAAVMVVDTRSFRDKDIAGPANPFDPAQVAGVYAATFAPGRTLLGATQFADLKQDLLDAQDNGITWKFVMIPEPIQNLFPGINTDAYEGYAAERTELLQFIDNNNIDNVVFVAADVHTTFVNNLTYQVAPFGAQIATRVFEITTGAVAYERPTGEFLAGLLTAGDPATQAFYNSLPIAPDTDSILNDRDDFVEQAVNSALLSPLGFDPLGLDNNLAHANGLIDATLLQGDYFVGHSYSWSEFDIDETTQQLTVTTYGIDGYTEAELLADPEAIIARTPVILSQFEVNPLFSQVGTSGRDTLTGDARNNVITGGTGGDIVTGGAGRDTFAYRNLRDAGDRITDFTVGEDKIDLSQLLDSLVAGGYNGINAIADGYIRVVAGASSNTFSVELDASGPANGAAFRSFISVQGPADLASFNNTANFIF